MNCKSYCLAVFGYALAGGVTADVRAEAWVSETPFEFIASADVNGDGRQDVVIADKLTDRYRIGYQLEPGKFRWAIVRSAGLPQTTGFTAGRLLDSERDALVFTSPDEGTLKVIDASNPQQAIEPRVYAPATLGPKTVVAIDIGGEGNTPLADLVVGTIYNAPEANRLDVLRNTGSDATVIDDFDLGGELQLASRVELKPGVAVVASFLKTDQGRTLRLTRFAGGEPDVLVELSGLAANADYLVGRLGKKPVSSVLLYEPGKSEIEIHEVQETSAEGFKLGEPVAFAFDEPVCQISMIGPRSNSELLVTFGDGEKAAVFELSTSGKPERIQSLERPPGDYWSGVANLGDDFVALFRRPTVKYSSVYQHFTIDQGHCVASAPGDLSTLDETDVKIYNLIMANREVTDEASMRSYTNTIPGTKVNYAMVPIPGGEFVMGSPEGEAERQADEGPQHRVRVAPFWMGKTEVTWDEFELFMYSDEERKFRDTIKTDPMIDKISDAVSRPTRPYVEMSFGMGRYGYPAIAMTQHGANKYCQWLSAKTGQFYRLPTEAEWEYACRAGTTTAYSFGDDPGKVGEYGWFEDNGDFKYQKVGRKKPNPWGLYDMHGNVWEWCLDQYTEDYSRWKDPVVVAPWNRATQPYPHVARGGSYDDTASRLRSAARRGSARLWKMQDPQLPKSVWWLSDAPWVGFRLVRPLEVPAPEELSKYWTSGVERD